VNVRDLLLDKLKELTGRTVDRVDIAAARSPDDIENLQMLTERNVTVSSLERRSKLIAEIKAAISRCESDEYGFCLLCDTQIAPKRLHALPWAMYCIKCQEEKDAAGEQEDSVESAVA
jgi:DnaK suppressor protein